MNMHGMVAPLHCKSLLWCHNGLAGVSNHQPHDCLLNRLFGCRSKKTSKFHVTGLCVGNSPGTGEFPAQMASNAENASIWRRHHGYKWTMVLYMIWVNHFTAYDTHIQLYWYEGASLCWTDYRVHPRIMHWAYPFPDSKVHGANMGPIWGRQVPGGPHVGPMNFAIWVIVFCWSMVQRLFPIFIRVISPALGQNKIA